MLTSVVVKNATNAYTRNKVETKIKNEVNDLVINIYLFIQNFHTLSLTFNSNF